jgi:phenylalanyl-tRNA synthetase beta chain
MKLSPQWIREFVDVPVDNRQLAHDLTDVGTAVEGIGGEGDSMTFEMEITTNRPDEMNHYGVAREASAIYKVPLQPVSPQLPSATGNANFAIEIEDPEGCARYTARIIRDTKIKPSPDTIAKRLELVDQRPINNAADASNYTLWEMGHPTHVFDLDLLEGAKIVVRRAREGESIKTLDGVDRKLSPEDLIIADAVKPVALAGVMGGFGTMITGQTRNILIESAWFDPVSVRKTAKRHGLHTDASHRFERGADFGATSLACACVARRILESGGGHLQGSEIDALARQLDLAPIALRISEVHRMLGSNVNPEQVARILELLGFQIVPEPDEAGEFTVHVPSWRLDVEREIDLIEEIARIHGYNQFPNTLPAFSGAVVEAPNALKDAKLRSALLALGYNEAVSLTFISKEDAAKFSTGLPLELLNALSEEASVMRTSLVPGMLQMLAYNLNRGTTAVRLFEAGNIYEAAGPASAEFKRICMGATAESLRNQLPQSAMLDVSKGESAAALALFRSLKGDVELLLDTFQYESLYYDSHVPDYYHPGRSARAIMNGATVAHFGQLHPEIATARKLKQAVFLAEVYLERLYRNDLRAPRYVSLARYPAVARDFSFIFEDAIVFEKIYNAVDSLGIAELRSFSPVEIFRGGAIPAGKYSILLRATFQSGERTLREEEIADWSAKLIAALQALGGTLRAS